MTDGLLASFDAHTPPSTPSLVWGSGQCHIPRAANVSLRSFLSMKPSLFWSMIVKACGEGHCSAETGQGQEVQLGRGGDMARVKPGDLQEVVFLPFELAGTEVTLLEPAYMCLCDCSCLPLPPRARSEGGPHNAAGTGL